MNILAFDTSTNACTVALQCGEQVYQRFEVAPRRHTELLLPMIDALIKEAGIETEQLDVIGYGHGPGSFMGVRLATGIAQGIGFATNAPLVPISTLQTLAQSAHQKFGSEAVLAAWDARMSEMYIGSYGLADQGLMKPIKADMLIQPEQVDVDSGEWLAVGNAWAEYESRIPKQVYEKIKKTDSELFPQAIAMLPIIQEYFQGNQVVEAVTALPLYLRNDVVRSS